MNVYVLTQATDSERIAEYVIADYVLFDVFTNLESAMKYAQDFTQAYGVDLTWNEINPGKWLTNEFKFGYDDVFVYSRFRINRITPKD